MEEKVFEYIFTRADYDELQDSLLTRDILGTSSWKGEERVVLYKNKLEIYTNGILQKEHLLSEFESFYDGEWSETNNQVLLVKKIDHLTPAEKNIWPILLGETQFSDPVSKFNLLLKQSLVISFRKTDARKQFCLNIEKFLTRINDLNSQSYSFSNNMKRKDTFWVFLILAMIIITIIFIYVNN